MSDKYLLKRNNPKKNILYCEHNNIKKDCYECYRSFFCIHNINKNYCKKCNFRKQIIKKEKKLTPYNIFVKNNMNIVKTLYPDIKQKDCLGVIATLWNNSKKDVYIDKDMNINIDPINTIDLSINIDPINPIDLSINIDSINPINPINPIDPTNPIDLSINTDSIDLSINTDSINSIDSIDCIDSIFSVIPTIENDDIPNNDIQYNLIDEITENIDLNEYYLRS